MLRLTALIRRELIAYFSSPLAYLVLTAFLFIQGLIFWLIVAFASRPGGMTLTPLDAFFGGTIFFWLIMLFVVPVITMRLIAEELRSGTIEVLLTAPITEGQVIIGKFVAAFVFYCALWAPTVIYVLMVKKDWNIDLGPVASGYLGVMVLGFLFMAVGTFSSTLSNNQLIAAIISFALLFVLFTVPLIQAVMSPSALRSALEGMSLFSQMEAFSKGIVDTRNIVYPVSVGLLFLFLATKSLEAKKGR